MMMRDVFVVFFVVIVDNGDDDVNYDDMFVFYFYW